MFTARLFFDISNRVDMGSSRRAAGRRRLAAHSMADSSMQPLRRWQRPLQLQHPDNTGAEEQVAVDTPERLAAVYRQRRRPDHA